MIDSAHAIMAHMGPVSHPISIRHTLAALAYRATRALEGAPPEFAEFKAGPNPRTPGRILAHMCDLMDWALSQVEGRQKWQNSTPLPWPDEVGRFFRALQALDERIAAEDVEPDLANRLFQAPIADALTHTGQIAMLRRMAGCPIRGENYFVAEIAIGRVGPDQAPSRRSF